MKKRKETRSIYIFRHGQTHYNEDHIFTGWKDSTLTKLGIEQAQIIARRLKNKYIDIAFQTSLSRSKDTLKEVLKFHPECKKIITDDRMYERDYGKLDGIHHETIIKTYGQRQFDQWHRGFSSRPPRGESFLDVEKRVKPFINDLIKLIKKQKINVAISAHGNSIRLFRKIMDNAPQSKVVKWVIPFDKFYEYQVEIN